jgi:MFS family permease
VAVELSSQGVAPQLTGLVMGAYFVGFGVGSLRAEHVIARIGPIRAFAAFGATLAATALALALHVSPLAWLALRFLGGVCVAGFFLVVEGWLQAVAAPESRGRVLSAYMFTVYLSLAGGQALLATRDAIGPGAEIFVLCGLLISLAVVPVALTRSAAPEIGASRGAPLAEIARRCPLGLAAGLGGGLAAGAFYGMGPVFALTTPLPLGGVAPFMTATLLGALLLQAPVGRLSDRIDRRRVLAGTSFAVVAASAAIPTLGAISQPVALALAALFGGAVLSIYPLGLAHLFDRVDRDTALAGLRTLLLAYAVGSSLGPLAAAGSMQALGNAGFFAFSAAVGLALGGYAVLRVRRFPPVPVEQQEAFVAAPRSTPALAELDPRAAPSAEA